MAAHSLAYILITAILLTAACTGNRTADPPVPRRVAYHRIHIPTATYNEHKVNNVTLQLNQNLELTDTTQPGWLTGTYAGNIATLYITVTKLTAGNESETIDNRIERLSMNTGGAPTEVTSFTTPAGLDARLLVTHTGSPTPVQFIATDHKRLLVSGSSVIENAPTAPPDSLTPVIDMLQRDITHLLNSL